MKIDSQEFADVRNQLTVTVPVAGRCVGLGRDASYRAADRGEIPTLRIGRRIVVPVAELLRMLGVKEAPLSAPPGAEPAASAVPGAPP